MDVAERFEQILRDGWNAPLATLIPRELRLHGVRGKAEAIIGMRRVGKTSLMLRHMADRVDHGAPRRSLGYVNFEDDRLAGLQLADLEHLHAAMLRIGDDAPERWFYLDEIQNVPGWERFVRRMVETPGQRVIITGSSSKLLSTEIATSMRGRSLTTELLPFSFREAVRFGGGEVPGRLPPDTATQAALERAFARYLHTGGFPEALGIEDRSRDALLRGYVDVVLLRDVIERHGVTNVHALRALTRRLLAQPGGAYTANKVTNDLKSQGLAVSRDVVSGLVHHLEDAFLVCVVPMATDSERKRAVNARKIYPIDPSLSASMARTRSENLGWKLENVVCVELRRRGYEVGWARTRSGLEIDFVAHHPDADPLLVQVAWDVSDERTLSRELRSFAEAAEEHGVRRGLLISRSRRDHWRAGSCDVQGMPAWWWLAGKLGVP